MFSLRTSVVEVGMQKVIHVLESIYSDADCHLSAVSLNDGHIFDTIFGDEYIMDIVGALECKFIKSASLLLHSLL